MSKKEELGNPSINYSNIEDLGNGVYEGNFTLRFNGDETPKDVELYPYMTLGDVITIAKVSLLKYRLEMFNAKIKIK